MSLYDIWKFCMETWGLAPCRRQFNMLMRQYAMPARRYHTEVHLEECFALWEQHRRFMEHPAVVALALFWHDAVYLPERDDNERSSALQFEEVFHDRFGLPDSERLPRRVVRRVHALIQATDGHTPTSDSCSRWVNSIDLAILGASEKRYDEYARQIHEEYGWVPDAAWRELRARFMQQLLDRERLFTAPLQYPLSRGALEARARANIQREIASLTA